MVRTVDLLKAIDLIYEAALDMRAWPPATEALADMMGAQAVSLPDRDGGSLAVEVLPIRIETAWLPDPPAAMVFIRDPKASRLPSHEQLRLLFGLTPAQAALAGEILEGDGIDAAALLGIKRSTARTHRLEVFQKSGTSRQAELVRVILQKGRGHQPGDPGSARSSHPNPINEEANSTSEVGSDTVAAPARSSRKVWHWPLRAV